MKRVEKRITNGIGIVVIGYALALVSPNANAQAFSWSWQSVLQFIKTMQSELSAWSVMTKQTSLSANVIAQSKQTSQQQLATSMGAIATSERVQKAIMSFDSNLGQPTSIKCASQKEAAMQVQAWSQMALDRSKLIGTFAATRVADKALAERERITLHKDSFCTISEAKSGVCNLKADGMQGWDSNYGGVFVESTLSSEGELAGYAYAAMVADTRAPAALDCKSSACAAAASQQLALSALGTMVADTFVGQVLERRIPMLTGE